MSECLRLSLPPDLGAVPEARRFVEKLGAKTCLSDERIFDVKVAVSEACANAIEHTKSGVELVGWLLQDRLILEISNDGPFHPGFTRGEGVRPRGLGLPLMVSLADHLHVARLPGDKTCVSMTFFLEEDNRRARLDELDGPNLTIRHLETEALKLRAMSSEAAEELYWTRKRLEFAQQAAGAGSWDLDLLSGRMDWTPELFELAGLDPATTEASLDIWKNALHPEDKERALAQLDAAIRDGAVLDSQHRIVRPDGQERWISVLGRATNDEAGQPRMMCGICMDITEHKHLEERVRASEERYQIVADFTQDWEHWITSDGRFNYVSPSVERITGYPPEAFVEDPDLLFRIVHPEDRELFRAHFQGTEPCSDGLEFRIFRRDGQLRFIEHVCQVVLNAEGQTLGKRGSNRDITGRKEIERALWESRAREQNAQTQQAEQRRFYDILERLPVMVRLLRPDHEVLFANRSFRDFFGEAEAQYLRRSTGDIDHWQWDAADGSHLDLHRFPLTDADGSPLILEMGIDITDPKHLEEELRSASLYGRSLIEASLDPLVTIDASGKITDANSATEQITGRVRSELVGTDFSDYFTEPVKARAGYEQVFRDGTVRDYPLEIAGKDGQITPVLYNASVYRDQRGEVAGVFAAARDVSGLRQAEAAAQAERQRLSDLLQMLPVYTVLLSPDYHVPFANRFFEERFGVSHGRRCFEYLFGRSEPCEVCESFVPFQTGAAHQWEWTGPDGRNYDIVDFPFNDVDGSQLIMEVGIDVTERKRAEAGLQDAHDRLEARVKERTDELMETTRRLQAEIKERQIRETEKERQFQEQREMTGRLQSALLNLPASIGQLKVGHVYRSATEQALVGGDFYDVFEVKGGRIGVLVGDVAGHGVEAARTATLVRDVIRAFAHLSRRPQEILRHANGLLVERSMTGFVTAVLGVINPRTRTFRYCSAGHPEALLKHASGKVETLALGSVALGVFPDASWTVDEVILQPGDILLLYTDGVIEARRNDDFFGIHRLARLLKRENVTVDVAPTLILDKVMTFARGSLRDDVAILALSLTDGEVDDPDSPSA